MRIDAQFDVLFDRMGGLPTLPGIALRILKAVQNDDAGLEEIGNIISTDPPLSAEVLKLINSSFYSLPAKITSVFHAVGLLGSNTVKNLALSFSLIKRFRNGPAQGFDYTLFWKDSLIGAVATKLLAEKIMPSFSEDAFFLGLLHNIGILTLVQYLPKQYSLVLKEIQNTDYTYHEAEDQILGFNHMAVGEYLIKKWGLPDAFWLPIGHHHYPDTLVTDSIDIDRLTKILHLASLYIDLLNLPDNSLNLGLIDACAKNFGFSNKINVDEIGVRIHRQTQPIFPLFDIHLEKGRDYSQILETARKELIDLSAEMLNRMQNQKREIEMLRKQITLDGLTQLNNYQHFYELLYTEIYRSLRYKSALSLIIADIDDFKAVNDSFGHLAGDHAIRTVAECLNRSLRASDHVARYGGEEFAVILPETSLEEAMTVAERLRQAIQSLEIIYEKKSISLTMSFGVASAPVEQRIAAEEFVKKADQALYKAKAEGKNRCCAGKT